MRLRRFFETLRKHPLMTQARFANVSEVPLALAVFLASDFYDHSDDLTEISATALLKPIRQLILPSRVPAGMGMVNLADTMQSRMGTAIHGGIEKAWKENHQVAMQALGLPQRVIDRVAVNPTKSFLAANPDCIPVYVEPDRFKRQITVGGRTWTITGKTDFIGEGRVQDFKSTSVYAYQKQTGATKWPQQGSIYRWLAPDIITEPTLDIHYIFTDWKQSFAKGSQSYPPKRFITQRYNLMSLQETEAYIRSKLQAFEAYVDAPEEEIPQCDDEELWRSEPQYKFYGSGYQPGKRSTKNFDSRQDAVIFMSEKGGKGEIREVPGQVTACKYCPAFAACTQKDQLIASGDLLMGM
jgi:hypothetical protein